MDELLRDPAVNRRGGAIEDALKARFEHALDDGQIPKMPPLRAIERRMLNVWESNEQKQRDDAQDETARELARKAGEERG